MTVRVPYLDGLRALAILMVVTFHTAMYHPLLGERGVWPWWTWMVNRDQGVYLFFVLSGFCLAYPTLSRLQQNGAVSFDVVKFASRRIVRIIPSYWLAIAALTLALMFMLHAGIEPGRGMTHHLIPVKILEQALLFNLRPEWLNGAFWTLPIEVHWYFACPILLWVWLRSRRAFAFIAVLLWFASVNTRFQAPDVQALPAFMMGVVAADLRLSGRQLTKYAPIACAAVIAFALPSQFRRVPLDFAMWQLGMFLFVVAAGEVRALATLFSARIFAPISAASYSIYLLHSPILSTLEKYAPQWLPTGAVLAFSAASAIAVGLLFSVWAEKPFRRGPVRDALLSRLDAALPKAFGAVGIARFMELTASHRVLVPNATPPEIDLPPRLSTV
jgi:peptidoglycan/LPS O-acetylase OafA/YrhL